MTSALRTMSLPPARGSPIASSHVSTSPSSRWALPLPRALRRRRSCWCPPPNSHRPQRRGHRPQRIFFCAARRSAREETLAVRWKAVTHRRLEPRRYHHRPVVFLFRRRHRRHHTLRPPLLSRRVRKPWTRLARRIRPTKTSENRKRSRRRRPFFIPHLLRRRRRRRRHHPCHPRACRHPRSTFRGGGEAR